MLHDLRCHVERSAQGELEFFTLLDRLGEAKVHQLAEESGTSISLEILINHDILQLQISVHNIDLVHICEAVQDLVDHCGSISLSEGIVVVGYRGKSLKQITMGNQLQHDVVAFSVLQQIKNTNDIRVINLLNDAQFTCQ